MTATAIALIVRRGDFANIVRNFATAETSECHGIRAFSGFLPFFCFSGFFWFFLPDSQRWRYSDLPFLATILSQFTVVEKFILLTLCSK